MPHRMVNPFCMVVRARQPNSRTILETAYIGLEGGSAPFGHLALEACKTNDTFQTDGHSQGKASKQTERTCGESVVVKDPLPQTVLADPAVTPDLVQGILLEKQIPANGRHRKTEWPQSAHIPSPGR